MRQRWNAINPEDDYDGVCPTRPNGIRNHAGTVHHDIAPRLDHNDHSAGSILYIDLYLRKIYMFSFTLFAATAIHSDEVKKIIFKKKAVQLDLPICNELIHADLILGSFIDSVYSAFCSISSLRRPIQDILRGTPHKCENSHSDK